MGPPLLRVRASPGTVVLITGGCLLYAPAFVPTADRSMSSSLSASQLHTVNMRDPLNRVLGAPSHPSSLTSSPILPSLPHLWPISPDRQLSSLPQALIESFSGSPSAFLSTFSFSCPHFGDTLGTSFFSQNRTSSQALLMEFSFPPLFHIANLFLLISSILGSRTAGPHTQFVQWFMEECVDCLEQGSRGSILQFMPFTTVSTPSPPPPGPGRPPLAQSRSASLGRTQGSVASRKGLLTPDITPTTTPLSFCLSDRYRNW